ncbi:MAG: nicotinate-nucleotide--dimethylbenzimidazole phosphoribosyltransferase [Robiginitomaculum sp.]
MQGSPVKPFDDMRALIGAMPIADTKSVAKTQDRLEKALGGLQPLGRLSRGVAWLAGWQEKKFPQINKPLVAVFMATHGVAVDIIGGDLNARAQKRLKMLSEGSAAVRGIAAAQGAAFKVYEMGLSEPCADMRTQPSLSERECAAAIAFGMETLAEGADIIALGCAGVGSAAAAAGIARGLYGGTASYWAGGHDAHAALRTKAVETAAKLHKNVLGDPLEVLRHFGGRDIAGMVGTIIAAGHQKTPILLDGFVVCAAAAIVHGINKDGLSHCMAAHLSAEPAHGALLDRINKKPLLDYAIGVGDGSGAALALGALKAATAGALTV